jgi:branched-chain amino acid transport system ATP-binding protein
VDGEWLGINALTADQQHILEALHRPPCRVLVPSAHDTGKSYCAAVAALYWHYNYDPGLVLTTAPSLELRVLCKSFVGIRAVDGMSLRVGAGERAAVIGPNGAGKSTLFALISGELRADAGEVLLAGASLGGVAPARRARLGLGRTFQSARLFAGLSVRENVELALVAGGRAGGGGDDERDGDGDGVGRALSEVGLDAGDERPAGALAQGERKRLELAMVLAGEPRVLLLDEPTAGRGREERAEIMELVVHAVARRGSTMVFSEHDMDTVFAHAQRVIVMDRGRPIADGTPEAVRGDELVRRVYLGGGGAQEVESNE